LGKVIVFAWAGKVLTPHKNWNTFLLLNWERRIRLLPHQLLEGEREISIVFATKEKVCLFPRKPPPENVIEFAVILTKRKKGKAPLPHSYLRGKRSSLMYYLLDSLITGGERISNQSSIQ